MVKKKVMFGDLGLARLLETGDNMDHEIQIGRRVYKYNGKPFRTGEFSTIHHGTDAKGKQRLIKIAKSSAHNEALERELRVIKFYQSDPKLKDVGRYLPAVKDSLVVDGRLVIVMRYIPDVLDVETIVQAHHGLMDPRDVAWVSRRVIAQVIAAEMGGLVHASILPPHVLVNRASHNPLHIGWAHALDPRNERVKTIVTAYREFYPPEVFKRRRPDCRTDIFMAGKTIAYMLGGDPTNFTIPHSVPDRLVEIVTRCTQEDPEARFQSGGEAMQALTKVVRDLWGEEFRELEV